MKAFTHAATGLAITDPVGNFIDLSPAYARLLALAPEHMSSANLLSLIHLEDRSPHQALLDQLLDGAIPGFTLEKRYVRADGSIVWVRNSVTAFSGDQPHSRHLIHISEDITDRKRLEQAVEAQDKLALLGRLTSSIAHEIANPLESVRNLLYLAGEQTTAEEIGSYLATANEELSRIAHIATETLQFHRQAPQPAKVKVAELVESVMAIFRSRIKAAKIEVCTEKRDDAILACHAVELRQVVANLIANAVDSMAHGGGKLHIRIRSSTDWRTQQAGVSFTIADTGFGMAAETRKRIYESFFRTKGAEGTGLGLWVSANIVNRYGGSIHVRSSQRSQRSGTAFTIIFPKTPSTRLMLDQVLSPYRRDRAYRMRRHYRKSGCSAKPAAGQVLGCSDWYRFP